MSLIGRLGLAGATVALTLASYRLGTYRSRSLTGGNTRRSPIYYVDPMHSAYRSDKPGIAPDCGMQLEPVFAEASSNTPPLSPAAVKVDGATQRLLGIRLAPVVKSDTTRTIRVAGRVSPEDTRVYRLNSGTDGFIRETYNDSVGVRVKKGQKLAAYFAPEVLAPASGFLAANARVPGAVGSDGARTVPFPGALAKQGMSSMQGYTDRLRNLGMSDIQIKRMAESGQLPESIEIIAPADGFVLARNITSGQHFTHDMEFYRIADLSRVWVVTEVYEQDASYLRPGGVAEIVLRDGQHRLQAQIADSLPLSDAVGGTVKLRLEVENPVFALRPEMLVDVELPVRQASAVTVPLDALVDSGERARVYVECGDSVFEPRPVETGRRFGEQVEISERASCGRARGSWRHVLVDSESRLKAPAARPAYPQATATSVHGNAAGTVKDPKCGMPVDASRAATVGNTLKDRSNHLLFLFQAMQRGFREGCCQFGRQAAGRRR